MTTSRFPNGITTATKTSPEGQFGLPVPYDWHVFFDDFDHYTAADWTITTTEAGTSSATEALGDADGGVLVVTNDVNDNDADFFNKVGESFLMAAGKKAIFAARFKVSDATQSDFVMGLQITDTTPLDVTDGIFFQKDDGDANLDFYVEKNNTATSASAIHTVVDDTYLQVAWYYNGVDAVEYFVDGVKKGTLAVTNLPDDEVLTISFGIQNGEAASKVLSVDYIFAAKER